MSEYRIAAPPRTTTIRLEALDRASVRIALAIFAGGMLLIAIASVAAGLAPRGDRALARVVAMGAATAIMIVALLAIRPRMKKLHYLVDLGEPGIARVRLLAPNGSLLADASNGSMRVVRTNYVRAGRHGSGWLRPGFRVHHPGGTFLVGTLFPQLPWDGVGQDPARPDFELALADHEALAERVGA